MPARLWRGIVLCALLGLVNVPSSQVASASTDPAMLSPTIYGIEPRAVTPWSYMVITGENLANNDGSCSVKLDGTYSYVAECSAREIRAVVPWTAAAGNVVVTADGLASQPFPTSVSPGNVDLDDIAPGVIFAKLRPDADIKSVAAQEGDSPTAATPLGGDSEQQMKGWYALEVPTGAEVEKSISYSSHSEVLYASPVPVPVPADIPNDTLYPSQWALAKIDASSAWTQSKGDGVKIAVIDTGFETSHPDLIGHMVSGWNCDGGQEVGPVSGSAHGTWVAGVAAAVTNNTAGVAGVGWNSSVVPLRLETFFEGQSCTQPNDLFLVDKAIAEGAKVINMSYTYSSPNPALCDKLNQAWGAGLVSIAAAGNDNLSTPRDPAACGRVIAVAATKPDDGRADYSNYGSWIDVSAPGGTGTAPPNPVCTGDATSLIYTTNYPSGYATVCGTSFAAPDVAGVAALLMAMGLDNCQVEETIKRTADPLPWSGGGAGRINAGRAATQPQDCPAWDAANAADFNADGRSDLFHLCCSDYDRTWLSTGGTSFNAVAYYPPPPPPPPYPPAPYPLNSGSWQRGDFNGDGRSDWTHLCCYNYAYVWTSNGDGTFAPQYSFAGYPIESGLWRSGDFNGDGRTDLIHFEDAFYARVWTAQANGTFSVGGNYSPAPGYAMQLGTWRTGDFNGDGRTDLLHLCCGDYANVWLSLGDGTFNVQPFTPQPGGYGIQLGRWRTGDFNGDGRTDLIHLCCADYANVWLAQSGGATFSIAPFSPWPLYGIQRGQYRAGDFNGDNRTDLIHFWSALGANVWLSQGNGTFAVTPFTPWANYGMWNGTWRTGDFNGDARSDLIHLWSADSSNIWLSQGTGATFGVTPYSPAPGYAMLQGSWLASDFTADRDGDGRLDATDNCPNWFNPAQNLPGWTIPPGDPDCDSWSISAETYIGTLPRAHCAATANINDENPDPWPPDFDDSKKVDINDVLALKPYFGTHVPPTSPRYDLVPSGLIDIDDVLAQKPFFGATCT